MKVWGWHNRLAREATSGSHRVTKLASMLAEKLCESSGHRVRVPIPFRFPKVLDHYLSVNLEPIDANIE